VSGLAAVLAGRQAPGVYLWHAAYDVADVRHTVEHAGWTFGHVDGWTGGSEAELHAALAATLGFPDWYGGNLDALWDCLVTCLVEPTVLLWDGWGPLAHAEPDRFPRILRVLRDRSDETPPFSVLLRGEGPGLDVGLDVPVLD
jgi:RNAse (barnase) inhibitor barstar